MYVLQVGLLNKSSLFWRCVTCTHTELPRGPVQTDETHLQGSKNGFMIRDETSHSWCTCKIIHILQVTEVTYVNMDVRVVWYVRKISWKPGKKDRLTIGYIMQLAIKLMIILKRNLTSVWLWCACFNIKCVEVLTLKSDPCKTWRKFSFKPNG